jgi:hypothetical protein
MFKKPSVFFLVALLITTAECAEQKEELIPDKESFFASVFGSTGYIITSSYGGSFSDFSAAATEVLETGKKVKIDGICLSSCAIFADEARPNVCITPRARFGFHMMRDPDTKEFLGPMPMSKDINDWVMRRGGYPFSRSRLRMMAFKDAKAFWPVCN